MSKIYKEDMIYKFVTNQNNLEIFKRPKENNEMDMETLVDMSEALKDIGFKFTTYELADAWIYSSGASYNSVKVKLRNWAGKEKMSPRFYWWMFKLFNMYG